VAASPTCDECFEIVCPACIAQFPDKFPWMPCCDLCVKCSKGGGPVSCSTGGCGAEPKCANCAPKNGWHVCATCKLAKCDAVACAPPASAGWRGCVDCKKQACGACAGGLFGRQLREDKCDECKRGAAKKA
jgi:hypothetical protein